MCVSPWHTECWIRKYFERCGSPGAYLQRSWSLLKSNPKRTLLAVGGLALSLGLCAIPGAPALIIGLLLVGGALFAVYQMYQAAVGSAAAQPMPTAPTLSQKASEPPKALVKPIKSTPNLTVPKLVQPKAPAPVRSKIKPFLAENGNVTADEQALAARCVRMAKPTTYGGVPELVALSNVLGRTIHVYSSQEGVNLRGSGRLESFFKTSPVAIRGSDIHLIHRNHGATSNLNHYDLFIVTPREHYLSREAWDNDDCRLQIPGDGNCLFRAVAEAVGSNHQALRAAAVKWIKKSGNVNTDLGLTLGELLD
jgi:hypothetical protein